MKLGTFSRPLATTTSTSTSTVIATSTSTATPIAMVAASGTTIGAAKNNKPAPNPYYLLDKYYGNLSIQQYRKLLKTEHMLLVIDKPLTRILPELHDDNDEFILNIYGGGDTKSSQSRQTGGGVYFCLTISFFLSNRIILNKVLRTE